MKLIIVLARAFTIAIWVYVIAATLASAAMNQCYASGHTGEGFPAITCTDGHTYYRDEDGTDGSLGTENDGRWVEINPDYVR